MWRKESLHHLLLLPWNPRKNKQKKKGKKKKEKEIQGEGNRYRIYKIIPVFFLYLSKYRSDRCLDTDESGNGQKQWKNGAAGSQKHVYRYHDEEERDSHQEQVLLFSIRW